FAFAQPDMSERRLGEHAVRNEPVPRAAVAAGEIVPDDAKVVDRDMRELWAAGAFADRPYIGCRRLQPRIDADVAMTIQLDAGLLQPDPECIRAASGCDQDVAAHDLALAGGCADGKAHLLPRAAAHIEGLGREQKSNTLVTHNPLHFSCDVGILTAHQ